MASIWHYNGRMISDSTHRLYCGGRLLRELWCRGARIWGGHTVSFEEMAEGQLDDAFTDPDSGRITSGTTTEAYTVEFPEVLTPYVYFYYMGTGVSFDGSEIPYFTERDKRDGQFILSCFSIDFIGRSVTDGRWHANVTQIAFGPRAGWGDLDVYWDDEGGFYYRNAPFHANSSLRLAEVIAQFSIPAGAVYFGGSGPSTIIRSCGFIYGSNPYIAGTEYPPHKQGEIGNVRENSGDVPVMRRAPSSPTSGTTEQYQAGDYRAGQLDGKLVSTDGSMRVYDYVIDDQWNGESRGGPSTFLAPDGTYKSVDSWDYDYALRQYSIRSGGAAYTLRYDETAVEIYEDENPLNRMSLLYGDTGGD